MSDQNEVSVEEMVAAINIEIVGSTVMRSSHYDRLRAASNYILVAAQEIEHLTTQNEQLQKRGDYWMAETIAKEATRSCEAESHLACHAKLGKEITDRDAQIVALKTSSRFFQRMVGAFGIDIETFRKDDVDAEEVLSLLATAVDVFVKSETKQGARVADAIRFIVKTYGEDGGEIATLTRQLVMARETLTWVAKQCSCDQYTVGNCEHTRARDTLAEIDTPVMCNRSQCGRRPHPVSEPCRDLPSDAPAGEADERHTGLNAHVCCEHDPAKGCCDRHPAESRPPDPEIATLRAENAEMLKVCGSKCPSCSCYLVEHDLSRDPVDSASDCADLHREHFRAPNHCRRNGLDGGGGW